MYTVTAQYLEAVRADHTKVIKVTHTDLFANVTTVLADTSLTGREDTDGPFVKDGSVTVDATSNVRRTLNLTLPGSEALWVAMDTVGAELSVSRGIRYVDGTVEWVPQGVFVVDVDQLDYAGDITVTTARDRWGRVQDTLLPPDQQASIPSHAAWQEIQRLVEGAWTTTPFPGWSRLDTTATTKVGSLIWDDGDREGAILKLCQDNGLSVYFDELGKCVLRPVPQLTDTSVPVLTVDAGDDGVLLSADTSRDRTRAFNEVWVNTDATDIIFPTQILQNKNHADPLSIYGSLGRKAVRFSSGSLRNSAQARAAGLGLLAKATGVAKQLSLTAVQNDAVDATDIILVTLPNTDANVPRASELHIVDTITKPFAPDGVMEIQTRSTVPATLGS